MLHAPDAWSPLAAPSIPAPHCDGERRSRLVRNEQAAFVSVAKAYTELAHIPLDGHLLTLARRAAHDAKERWARALGDLDRSQGWE
jgi:hypothetical protein